MEYYSQLHVHVYVFTDLSHLQRVLVRHGQGNLRQNGLVRGLKGAEGDDLIARQTGVREGQNQ